MTVYWKTLDDFIAMGGYGPYVWGSFGVVALGIVIELVALRQRRRALMSQADEGDEP